MFSSQAATICFRLILGNLGGLQVSVTNTDLLPPLFDQVLDYFKVKRPGTLFREDIVKNLESGVVNAAAAHCREEASRAIRPQSDPLVQAPVYGNDKSILLMTSDRLSGSDLSRAALVQQLQTNVELTQNNPSLGTTLIEIALLLIEAQIDLRLQGEKSFKIAGIEFSRGPGDRSAEAADWCQSILAPAMQSAAEDKPTVWSAFGRRKPAGIRVLVDTIQLSATLRTAVPYRINVDRKLVEPLLAEPRAHQVIRLLHVSDLHLTAELDEVGRKLVTPALAPTHSFEAARYVASAVAALQPRYDALVATGDLTTDGARESFETVLQYFQSGSITGANPMRIAAYGLKASRFQRVLLPGNHDRYAAKEIPGQRLDFTCEEILQIPCRYPYMLGYRPHNREDNSFTLLFLVFDSNLQAGRDGSRFSAAAWKRALAKGEIKDAELIEACELVKATMEAKEVERIGGGTLKFDPSKTIRIALLHHHPVTKFIPPKIKPDGRAFWQDLKARVSDLVEGDVAENMAMENSEAFLKCCSDCGIQLILFGHQHDPYQRLVIRSPSLDTAAGSASMDSHSKDKSAFLILPNLDTAAKSALIKFQSKYMRAFCCPSTLQYDVLVNGFYVFDFISESQFEWAMYRSLRIDGPLAGPMRQVKQKSFDLSRGPTQDELDEGYTLRVT
jgi:hypothetical protein